MDLLKSAASAALSASNNSNDRDRDRQQRNDYHTSQAYDHSHQNTYSDSTYQRVDGPKQGGSATGGGYGSTGYGSSGYPSSGSGSGSGSGGSGGGLGDAAKEFIKGFTGGEDKRREEEARLREQRLREEEAARQSQGKGLTGVLGDILGGPSGRREEPKREEKGGFLGGLTNKFEESLGGGRKAEEKEDWLDKSIDAFQEHVLKQGPQDNESVLEQKKDEQIANFIRGATGIKKKE